MRWRVLRRVVVVVELVVGIAVLTRLTSLYMSGGVGASDDAEQLWVLKVIIVYWSTEE